MRPLPTCRLLLVLLVLPLFSLCSACAKSSHQPSQGMRKEVRIVSHGDTLAASLILPAGKGPFPAAVIVHGSGSSPRANPWTKAYVEALVERGVAVLYPDKRGSGGSQGDWQKASFAILADDALAALDRLLEEPRIDAERVGLIGFSQGGDIVPLAATLSLKVKFVVDVSGSVVPLREQIGDEIRQTALDKGCSEEELKTLRELNELGMRYALQGEGWQEYSDALMAAKHTSLKESEVFGGFPGTRDHPIWGFLHSVGDFDPLPYWEKVKVPALFLYGGKDRNVDTRKSAAIVENTLFSPEKSFSLLFFGKNGHGLFRDDAMDFLVRWIGDKGID